MKLRSLLKVAAASLLIASASAHSEIELTGFASINAGKVLSGTGVEHYGVEPTFLADYPIVSAYGKEWDFAP